MMHMPQPEVPDYREYLDATEYAEKLYNARIRETHWLALPFDERMRWVEDAKTILQAVFAEAFDVGYEHGYDVGVAVDA